MVLLGAHRRHHLHQEPIGIVAGDAEIGRRRFHGETHALPARIAHHFEALTARQMHDIEMCAGHLGEIERGLDRQRFGDRAGCANSQSASVPSFFLLQFLSRLVDQDAGLAMNAGDRVGPKRRDGAKAIQQHVIGDRFHDARHSRHVELERADAELLGVKRDFGNLLFGENLRVKHRIDVAQFIHCAAERRQMAKIGFLEAAQEYPDGGHAAEHCGARLGFGFFVVGRSLPIWVCGSKMPGSTFLPLAS